MIKKILLIVIITLVVAGLVIVAIARYQNLGRFGIARGLSAATDRNDSPANLEADTLIAASRATAIKTLLAE